jgi:hypothetical protein
MTVREANKLTSTHHPTYDTGGTTGVLRLAKKLAVCIVSVQDLSDQVYCIVSSPEPRLAAATSNR